MPWEVDSDISIERGNFTAFKEIVGPAVEKNYPQYRFVSHPQKHINTISTINTLNKYYVYGHTIQYTHYYSYPLERLTIYCLWISQ